MLIASSLTLQGNSWQQITPSGSPPTARYEHVGAWSTSADGLYIFGGYDGGDRLNDLWLFSRQAGNDSTLTLAAVQTHRKALCGNVPP